MKNKYLYIALGVFLSLFSGALFLGFDDINSTDTVSAEQIIEIDGDLYLASSVSESKKITDTKQIKKLFGENGEHILVGKGYEILDEIHSQTFGTNLYLLTSDGTEKRKVTDKLVEYATLEKNSDSIFYLTVEGEIYMQDIVSGEEKKVSDHASLHAVSPDGKYLAYKKMPIDWVPGGYADGSPGVVITTVATGQERVIAAEEADHAAFWTPDGNHLYFFGDNGHGLDSLFMIDTDGSNRTLITNIGLETYIPGKVIPSISEPPIISKDGKFFVYESDREIWLVEIDTQARKLIQAKRIAYGINPKWIEEGETLSVVSGGNSKQSKSLIIIDVDGRIVK